MADISTSLTVRDIKALDRTGGDTFTSVLLIKRIAERPTKTGNPFLMVELADKTGNFNVNCFSDNPSFEFFKSLKEGAVVRIEAKVDYYQNRLSPKLLRAEEISADQLAGSPLMANLVETAPEDADALWTEFQGHIAAIAHAELRATVQSVFDEIGEAFRSAPAALAMHHAYRHGLLEHTCHMARACRALAPLYPEVDADLALAGILVHDTGKVIEYQGTLSTSRSRKGILQGHVVLGYQLVRKAGLKAESSTPTSSSASSTSCSATRASLSGAQRSSPRRPKRCSSPRSTTSTRRWAWCSACSARRGKTTNSPTSIPA